MKKLIFVTIVLSLLSSLAFAATGDTAVADATWVGEIPTVITPDASFIITGQNADLTIDDGMLNIATDGTFTSSSIILEAHEYTPATVNDPEVVGQLVSADWDITGTPQLVWPGADLSSVNLAFEANGGSFTSGVGINNVSTVNLTAAQTSPINYDNTVKNDATLSMTVVATQL